VIVLGIHDGHNASAALFVEGRLAAAVCEERLSRCKNEYGFPARAIRQCLLLAGIETEQIDRVAMATRHLPPKYFLVKRNANFTKEDYWREQTEYWYPRIYERKNPSYLEIFKDKVDEAGFDYDRSLIADEDDVEGMQKARVRKTASFLALSEARIRVYDHHCCHAHYAACTGPETDRTFLVFTADGAGDGANGTIQKAVPGKPMVEMVRTAKCNIGRMYRYATLLLGMKQNEHEYKVMGLAPYAKPEYCQDAYRVYADTLQVEGVDFDYRFQPQDHFFYFKERLACARFDAVAYAVQKRTEELLCRWVENGISKYGIRNVRLSGGVALNVKANQKIWEMAEVQNLFVGPGPGDESLSIGAGYAAMMEAAAELNRPLENMHGIEHAYLGRAYTDGEIKRAIDTTPIASPCRIQKAGETDLVELLLQGEVVARFAGPMEFGPRALGNRSILADPRRPETVRTINEMIKLRDFWMPFAPSILADNEKDYIVNPKRIDARFMTVSFDSTAKAREELRCGLHPYDATMRPQIVTADANPAYHRLLRRFKNRTGIGGLLNTSFNLHGEPIVESPKDALSTFDRSGLRHLFMGGWLLSKTS